MKKLITFMMILTMVCSFTLTAHAGTSPSGKPVADEGVGGAGGADSSGTATSPKTGECDMVLYSLGAAAVVLASGAVVFRKKVQ